MRMKAKRKNDSIFFYIPSHFRNEFKPGDIVIILIHNHYIVGKVIRNSGKLYVRVPLGFSGLIKEGEEYEVKKVLHYV